MSTAFPYRIAAAALGLWLGGGVAAGQQEGLQARLSELQIRNRALEQGLAEANRAEKEASEQLAKVRLRLEALGSNLLDGGDERLVEAAADLQILHERIVRLEGRALKLGGAIDDYLGTAVAADPDARLRVETAMRELDEVLGLRQKPAPASATTSSANRAKVLSIDSESGLLVFNVGEDNGTRIGNTYRLYRGEQAYGTAIVADVRREIAGAFVESLEPGQGPVRLGDLAILEIQ